MPSSKPRIVSPSISRRDLEFVRVVVIVAILGFLAVVLTAVLG